MPLALLSAPVARRPRQLLIGLALLLGAGAQAQVLDPSFRPADVLQTGNPAFVLAQVDGQRVLAGNFSRVNGRRVGPLIRLTAAGTLDSVFSNNVRALTSEAYSYETGSLPAAQAVWQLPGGKYLLLREEGQRLRLGAVTRRALLVLNPDGTPDAGFDAEAVLARLVPGPGAGQVLVQPDGRIILPGSQLGTHATEYAIRLNPDGSRDPGFVATYTAPAPGRFVVCAMGLQADGKVVLAGYDGQPSSPARLLRLLPGGSLDASFQPATLPTNNGIRELLVQPDGRLLVALSNRLIRLLPDGQLDAGFTAALPAGTYANYQPYTTGRGARLLLQPQDGKIVVAPDTTAALVRLLPDGSRDAAFNVAGAQQLAPGAVATALALDLSGQVLLSLRKPLGRPAGLETGLYRLTGTGARDASFGPVLQAPGYVSSLLLMPGGNVVVTGNFTEIGGVPARFLAQLRSTGQVDTAFTRLARTTMPAASVGLGKLVLQPQTGRILAIGYAGPSPSRSVLWRVLPSGRFDPTLQMDASLNLAGANDLAVQSTGRILLCAGTPGSTRNSLYRLLPDGATDPSFPTQASLYGVHRLYVQNDDRIVVNLYAPSGFNIYYIFNRLTANGQQDPGFTGRSNMDRTLINQVVAQPDGQLIATSSYQSYFNASSPGISRIANDGSTDPTFRSDWDGYSTGEALLRLTDGSLLAQRHSDEFRPSFQPHALARLHPNGQTDGSFNPALGPNYDVLSMAQQPDGAVLIGGSFTEVGGQPRVGIARLAALTPLSSRRDQSPTAAVAVYPNPAEAELRVQVSAGAEQPQHLRLVDALGRTVRQQPIRARETMLDVRALPAGLYVLRLEYARGGHSAHRVVLK